ncbi:MAG: hypothetical protein ACLF0G_13405 [Candidatus Brocadiia bacterium]
MRRGVPAALGPCLLAVPLLAAAAHGGGRQPEAAEELAPVAWLRVQADTPQAEDYQGTPYVWTGRADIRLVIDVPPRPGHVLELSWGSKDDAREAVALINGHRVPLAQGGYDGFRPLRVPVPREVKGERYEIVLHQGHGKAGFVAAVRLLAPGAAETPADREKPSHKVTLSTDAPTRPAAFPEMQALWAGEPPPPPDPLDDAEREAAFRQAARNALRANEMFFRCRKFVEGWLAHADPKTGLIPRNLGGGRDVWDPPNAAADNYPFMVLTAALTDRSLFQGRMLQMLRTETRLTSRIDRLPDTWSFSKGAFARDKPDLGRILFGASEYVKDGLLPLTEWLGPSPWAERMLGIVDDIWKHAPVQTPHGPIPSTNVELNGEMLQALSRITWMTGEEKYLEWAIRLGDTYLLGDRHPTRDFRRLRLRDHGCEIVSGLSELYVAVAFARKEKKQAYQQPIHEMFDRILEVGRTEHGMLYNSINPKTGDHDDRFCDTWGYNYNGVYTLYLVDGTESYRQAVRHVLGNLKDHLTTHNWGSADEFADSIEGAINLYNREPIPSAADWIDSEIRDMWSKQRPDGVIEGWHGDGNSARTAIMYALWKTQGATVRPWRRDLCLGAVQHQGTLCLSLRAGEPWGGTLLFDVPRHKVQMHLPLDYPRINQFPEWFTVQADASYLVRDLAAGTEAKHTGRQLHEGLAVELEAGKELRLEIAPARR